MSTRSGPLGPPALPFRQPWFNISSAHQASIAIVIAPKLILSRPDIPKMKLSVAVLSLALSGANVSAASVRLPGA